MFLRANLWMRTRNLCYERALEKISTSCWWDFTWIRHKNPDSACCLTKWTSMSICFDIWWETRLEERWMVETLSHNNKAIWDWCWKKRKSYLSHNSSKVMKAITLYSASIEDMDTIGCFFEFHARRESHMNI